MLQLYSQNSLPHTDDIQDQYEINRVNKENPVFALFFSYWPCWLSALILKLLHKMFDSTWFDWTWTISNSTSSYMNGPRAIVHGPC